MKILIFFFLLLLLHAYLKNYTVYTNVLHIIQLLYLCSSFFSRLGAICKLHVPLNTYGHKHTLWSLPDKPCKPSTSVLNDYFTIGKS